jgi:hypothetical protein
MGLIGETLASQINNDSEFDSLQEDAKIIHGIGSDSNGVNDAKKLIEKGHDPLHAGYIFTQNLISEFAECMSVLPELKAYCEIVGPAEEEYMPSGPPMSPLTGSYFTCWAFFDIRFGPDKETIGTCLLDIISRTDCLPGMSDAIELMQNSRMGVYEHLGIQGGRVILQDIMTQEKYLCYIPTGYWGNKGQLWMVRLLPPINESFDYNIVFNTPYLLMGESKEEWLAFIKRAMLGSDIDSYYDFMKYGPDIHYWNEFIFQAYHNHLSEVIFLSGIPDVQTSLPHGELKKTILSKPPIMTRSRKRRVKKKKRRKG